GKALAAVGGATEGLRSGERGLPDDCAGRCERFDAPGAAGRPRHRDRGGGDGTLNEVVNGFFAGGEMINPAARLGIACCGTGADFVRSVGLPSGLAAVPHLAAGRTVAFDLGLATFRGFDGVSTELFFLNFADLGMGGETVARVNRTTKVLGGFVSFLWGAVATILKYRCTMAEIAIDDGEPVRSYSENTVPPSVGFATRRPPWRTRWRP
ncbi:MAG: diacylglycerol kinase family protein, partial [Actinomycetota bacterium]|nr:diacylglycerol kinase family protein [Actinomycetota bacterium]